MELEKLKLLSLILAFGYCVFLPITRTSYIEHTPSHLRNILGSISIFFQGLILILGGFLCVYYFLNFEYFKPKVFSGFIFGLFLFFFGIFLVWVSIFVDNVRIREILNGLIGAPSKYPEYRIKLHKGSDGKIKIFKKIENKDIPKNIAVMFYEKRKIKIKIFSFLILTSFIIAVLNIYLEFHSPFDKLAELGAFLSFLAIPFLGVIKCPSCNHHYIILRPQCPICGFKLKK